MSEEQPWQTFAEAMQMVGDAMGLAVNQEDGADEPESICRRKTEGEDRRLAPEREKAVK